MSKLLHMMPAMHEMEFPPLRNGEGAENGMVEDFAMRSEPGFAICHDLVHCRDRGADFGEHFLGGNSARTRDSGRFPARRQVSESDDYPGLRALLPVGSGCQRLASLGEAAKSLQRAGVGQIQVFGDFDGAPLTRRVPEQLLRGKLGERRSDLLLQLSEVRVHEGY